MSLELLGKAGLACVSASDLHFAVDVFATVFAVCSECANRASQPVAT